MSKDSSRQITVAGAGLGGALMALYLARAGYEVTVYEGRPDPRQAGFRGGRSINLALSERGLHALREVGLADAVLAEVIPMRGRMMHARSGDLSFQPYSRNEGDAINSVSRGGLNLRLIEAADAHPDVRLLFEHRCTELELDPPTLTLARGDGVVQVETGVLIGADGAFSVVRSRMQRIDRFDYRQDYLEHGYKELTIPPGRDGDFAIEPHALHIWPRGGFMMIALPNQDRSFTCTLFWPFRGPNSFDAVQGEREIERFFGEQFPDAVPLMPTLVEDYQRNPTSSLVTVRCRPWHYKDQVVLLGDAAHAIVPFYGQGMNCAFEDCSALAACIDESAPDFKSVFSAYEARRRRNADAIADMAIDNFIEMRDHVGSPTFLMRKRLEKTLHGLLPGVFVPLYNMVSFTTIPYAEARERARRQGRLLQVTAAVLVLLLAGGVVLLLVALTRSTEGTG